MTLVHPGPVITTAQRKALVALVELSEPRELLAPRRRVNPRAIAKVLWPDSPGWSRATSRHDGKAGGRGATMPMNAAKILWRLRDDGLAVSPVLGDNGWVPTEQGLRLHAYFVEVGLAPRLTSHYQKGEQ